MAGRYVLGIKAEHIGYGDLIWITAAFFCRLDVLPVEIGFELSFSVETIISAATRALLIFAIPDDVDGGVCDAASTVPAHATEPQSCPLGCNRHSRLMSSIAASVV